MPVPHTTATPWPSDVPARSAPSPSLTSRSPRRSATGRPSRRPGTRSPPASQRLQDYSRPPRRHRGFCRPPRARRRSRRRSRRGPPRPSSRRYRHSRLARSRALRHRGPQRWRPSWCCRHRGRERFSHGRQPPVRTARRDEFQHNGHHGARFGRHRCRWYRRRSRTSASSRIVGRFRPRRSDVVRHVRAEGGRTMVHSRSGRSVPLLDRVPDDDATERSEGDAIHSVGFITPRPRPRPGRPSGRRSCSNRSVN